MYNMELLKQSKTLALDVINMYKYLTESAKPKETMLAKQLLLTGTKIGDHIRQEQLLDAFHSAASAHYWLSLLIQADYLDPEKAMSLENDLMNMKTQLYELSHKQN